MLGPSHLVVLALVVLASTCASGQSTAAAAAHCPVQPNLRSCGRANPDLSACISKGLTEILRYLAPGVPSLGIRSIEPLAVPDLSVRSAQGQSLELTSCSVAGGSTSVISALFTNLVNRTFWDFTVPNFKLTCTYKMAAGFLSVTTPSSGQFTLSISNYKNHYDCNPFLTKAECKETYVGWNTCTSTVTGFSNFQPHFSGLSAALNTQVNTATLRGLLFATFGPAQGKLNRDYLAEVYKYMPPLDVWLPVSNVDYVPFCLDHRPTKCSA